MAFHFFPDTRYQSFKQGSHFNCNALFAASPVIPAVKKEEVIGKRYGPIGHKYLQAALVADENVAAKHGNQTADFLLVLANIVSKRFHVTVFNGILSHYRPIRTVMFCARRM